MIEIDLPVAYSSNPTYSIVYDGNTTNLLISTMAVAANATLVKKSDSADAGSTGWTNYTKFDPRNKLIRLN